ncbi:MAG: pyruvate kinase, partial [Oscillospiraceae bacterium]
QMLESMISNPRPTRAEITDVANAIYDGTSAIMLSGETAAGKYPIEAVKTMSLIAETTERDINYISRFKARENKKSENVTEAISHATVTTAHDLDAAAILTVTKGGSTARMISKYRPNCPIIGLTTSETTCRQMKLSWGIIPGVIDEKYNTDELIDHAIKFSVAQGYIKPGDLIVITAGVPLGKSGTTNLIKVETVK